MNKPYSSLRPVRRIASSLAFVTASLFVAASGTRVGFKDAYATGRGNAFVATADNPSAIYYNPAGLTQLEGTQISTNYYHITTRSGFSGTAGSANLVRDAAEVPAVYLTYKSPGSPFAYGLGLYAPFGLATEWPANSPLRTFALKNKETYRTINFSLGWQLSRELSLGASFTHNRATLDLQRALGVFGPTDLFRFEGRDNALGFNLGLLWQPTAQHRLGLSYSHHTSFNLRGTSSTIPLVTAEPASSRFAFPENVILGWSYRPVPEWNLEINLDWTNWNRFDTATIVKGSGNTTLPFFWESGLFYELGATRTLGGGWHASAGWCFTENSTPDVTYTPAVPDSDKTFWSLGLGYRSPANAFSADLAWQYGDGGRRRVTGSPPDLLGATADGTYANSLHAFSLSLGLRF